MSIRLPRGWTSARISEICDVAKNAGHEGQASYLEIGNVDTGSKDYILSEKASVKGCRIAKKNDILVSKVRPTRGAIVWIREDELHVSSAFTILRNRGAFCDRYLWYFLAWNRDYLNYLGENCTGTMYPTTSDEVVVNFEVPIAPLSEQLRILDKLEKILVRVDAYQKRLAEITAMLKNFRNSVLAAACSGRLTTRWREERGQEDAWPATNLHAVVQKLDQGWSPKCEIEPSSSSDIWGVIKTTAIQPQKFIEYENKRLPNSLLPRPDLEIKENDMLITRAGPRARAGVCCLVRSVRPRLLACDKVYRFRVNKAIAEAEYLELMLNTPEILYEIDRMKTGTSDSGVNLTQEKFLALNFNLPPLAEQQEIVRQTKQLFRVADQVEGRLLKAYEHGENLKISLLSKAFSGKLVHQDPHDEPAEKICERIRGNQVPYVLKKRERNRREPANN